MARFASHSANRVFDIRLRHGKQFGKRRLSPTLPKVWDEVKYPGPIPGDVRGGHRGLVSGGEVAEQQQAYPVPVGPRASRYC